MRITDKMVNTNIINSVQKNRSEMNDLQNQASTQKKLTKPSDDPSSIGRVMTAKKEEKVAQQFIKDLNYAKSFLEITDVTLGELSELLMRAKELAIQQANDAGSNPQSRRIVASEIEQLFNQTIQIANKKMADRYIFSGFQTTKQPFDMSGNYNGDDGDLQVRVNKDAAVAMNVSGEKIFLGENLSADGTIRSATFTPATIPELKDLQQKDFIKKQTKDAEMQEQEQNEPTGLRAPASVQSSLASSISNSRGQASPAYQSKSNQFQSGVNILSALKEMEIGLRTNDKQVIQNSIESMDAALQQVVNARSTVGSRVQLLNTTLDSLQKNVVDQKVMASIAEDADLVQVVSDMSKADSSLKASLETSGKIANLSLLDYIK
jgi:flagellar hook-associated protein 3 FlgL